MSDRTGTIIILSGGIRQIGLLVQEIFAYSSCIVQCGFMSEWNYNPNLDYDALSPSLPNIQQGTGSNLQASKAGYDPLWLYSEYGDRLRLLPADLYDAVFEAMRGGTTDPFLAQYISVYSSGAALNRVWVSEAKVYLPELE